LRSSSAPGRSTTRGDRRDGVALLAASDVVAVLARRRASSLGRCPARSLVDAGAAIALATD
jgi:hypothetical protein